MCWEYIVETTAILHHNRARKDEEADAWVPRRHRVNRAVSLEEVKSAVLAHADESASRTCIEGENGGNGNDETQASDRCDARARLSFSQHYPARDGYVQEQLRADRQRRAGRKTGESSRNSRPSGRPLG